MSDKNRRSRSTLWRQARSEMSRALDSAVLNVDTIDEMYENYMDCSLHYENAFESAVSFAAAADSSELNTAACELRQYF